MSPRISSLSAITSRKSAFRERASFASRTSISRARSTEPCAQDFGAAVPIPALRRAIGSTVAGLSRQRVVVSRGTRGGGNPAFLAVHVIGRDARPRLWVRGFRGFSQLGRSCGWRPRLLDPQPANRTGFGSQAGLSRVDARRSSRIVPTPRAAPSQLRAVRPTTSIESTSTTAVACVTGGLKRRGRLYGRGAALRAQAAPQRARQP